MEFLFSAGNVPGGRYLVYGDFADCERNRAARGFTVRLDVTNAATSSRSAGMALTASVIFVSGSFAIIVDKRANPCSKFFRRSGPESRGPHCRGCQPMKNQANRHVTLVNKINREKGRLRTIFDLSLVKQSTTSTINDTR